MLARCFIVGIVAVAYALSLANPRSVFTLGIWCFSGFAGLFPLICASIYWRRVTSAGAYASILVTGLVWVLLFRQSGYGVNGGFLFLGMMPVATMFVCSLVALVGVSLLTAAPSAATMNRYFPSRRASAASLPALTAPGD